MITSITGIGVLLTFIGKNLFGLAENSIRNQQWNTNSAFGKSGSPYNYYCMSCGTKHDQSSCKMRFQDEKSRILKLDLPLFDNLL
jgi:hypothetical protein